MFIKMGKPVVGRLAWHSQPPIWLIDRCGRMKFTLPI
jgi:hypothetical protein